MKKGILKKIIKILIIIIIPLAAGIVTGSYAYRRYQPHFFDYYMDSASQEDTEDRLVSYLKFMNQGLEYEEKDEGYKFYYSNDFKNEFGDLFRLSIIRGSKVVEEKVYNKVGTYIGMEDVYYLTYYIAIYNVNYQNLAKTLDPTEEHKLLHTELPKLSIEIKDKADAEKTKSFDLSTVASVAGEDFPTIVYDYGYSPEKDSKGNKLNAGNPTSMRYYVLQGNDLAGFSSDVDLTITVNSNWSGDDQVTETIDTFELTDLYNNKALKDNKPVQEKIDTFNKGYEKDKFKAGYSKYAWGHYIWWEALIAIALFELVCTSFVLVWNSEDEREAKKNNKK